MAIRTQRLCEFDAGAVVLSFDWDDVTGNVTAIRCVNATARSVYAGVFGTGSGPAGRSREATFGTGTTTIAIPGGQQPRYVVTTDENGQPTVGGFTLSARFPA